MFSMVTLMIRKLIASIAAAFAVLLLASPASAGGYHSYKGYDYGYYGSYKDAAPYYPAPAYRRSRVTVYQAPPVYVPAPTYYYTYPVYSYGYADCGCKRWKKRWRRACW